MLRNIRFISALRDNSLDAQKAPRPRPAIKAVMIKPNFQPGAYMGQFNGKTGICLSTDLAHGSGLMGGFEWYIILVDEKKEAFHFDEVVVLNE